MTTSILGATAVACGLETRFEVPRKMLAENIREGDVVELIDGIYVKNKNATDERRKKIIELQNNLWE